MPGFMKPKDLEFMIPVEADPEEYAREHFRASDGTIVNREALDGQPGEVAILTLVPRHVGEGENWLHCRHLKDDRCEIHDIAPFGCRFFDCKQQDEQGKQAAKELSALGVQEIIDDHWAGGLYSRLCFLLWHEGLRAPGRDVRQKAIIDLYEQLLLRRQQEQLPVKRQPLKLEELLLPRKQPQPRPQRPRRKNWLRPRRRY
jgi:Fe-S-cluster containining protein